MTITMRDLSIPVSVDDVFTVGVSFDLLGGYLLGRGLLASPYEIARRTFQTPTIDHHFNAPEAVSHIHSRADALAGLLSLAVGFALQWGGYVALIAGARLETGPARAVVAVVLALTAAGAAFVAFRLVRSRLVRRLTVLVARANPVTGRLDDLPDQRTLIELAQAQGIDVVEVSPEGAIVVGDWAKETFGVEGVFQRMPFGLPAAPRRR